MDIRKYTPYFHDGGLIDFKHTKDGIELWMESAEVDPSELSDNIVLSKHQRIQGKLHLEEIQEVQIDRQRVSILLEKNHDSGSIFDFNITTKNKQILVTLLIVWYNYPPKKKCQTDLICYEITAKKMHWQSIPDLLDPFW